MRCTLDRSLDWGGTAEKEIRKRKAELAEAEAQRIREAFLDMCKENGLKGPWWEFQFHPERKWRWDYAWPDELLALEVDGGVWVGGKHGRGSGIVKDQEKRNAGAILGWRLLLVVPKQLLTLGTVELVAQAMGAER